MRPRVYCLPAVEQIQVDEIFHVTTILYAIRSYSCIDILRQPYVQYCKFLAQING